TQSGFFQRRWGSSWSRSPTRSSRLVRSPASTTSTCAPPRSSWRCAPRTRPQASARGSRSAPAAPRPRGTRAIGARSQIAGAIAAAGVALVLLFLTEPVQYLPKGVLAAVIVFAAIGLIEPSAWRALAAIDAVEVAIAGVTTGCVVAFGVLQALIVA